MHSSSRRKYTLKIEIAFIRINREVELVLINREVGLLLSPIMLLQFMSMHYFYYV